MKIVSFFDRIHQKIKRSVRNRVFKEKTGYRAQLVGDITLINTNLKLGKDVVLYPNILIFGDGPIIIGDNVNIGSGTVLFSSKDGGGITIGDNTQIAAQCYLVDMNHSVKKGELISNQQNTVSPIVIGKDVWIGAGAKILKGAKINDGAVIGAQSVVNGEIPENGIAVGVPAKVKKFRE